MGSVPYGGILGARFGMQPGGAAMAGHIVVDVGSLNPEPLRSAGAVHSRTHRTQVFSPPRAGFPLGNARRPPSDPSAPVGGKARSGLAVPAAEPLRLTCGRDTRPFAAEFQVPADCLPVTGCRWSRLIASWLVVYRCRGLEQHDGTNGSNPSPVQPPPAPLLVVVTSPWCSGRRENHRGCGSADGALLTVRHCSYPDVQRDECDHLNWPRLA